MRVSKVIPILIIIAAGIFALNVGMGSFADNDDYSGAKSDRFYTYSPTEYILLSADKGYSKLKVGDTREAVFDDLEADGFYRVHERTIGSHPNVGLGDRRRAHNIIILERPIKDGEQIEVVEVIFRFERFPIKFREGLANSPKIYTYEKI